MPIDSILLNEIEIDFENSLYSFLLKYNHNKFWNWFSENANEYPPNNEFKIVNEELEFESGECFRNTLQMTINEGKKYVEGFYCINSNYTLHAFNLNNRKVEDYTLIQNKDKINVFLPTKYVGVIIEPLFILDKIKLENYLNVSNPLIFEYFKFSQNR